MLSVRPTDNQSRITLTGAIVIATLLVALALSGMALFQVLEEYHLLGAWLRRPEPVPVAELQTLREDIGARIIARSVATAALLVCTLFTLGYQHRALTIRRTLQQVQLLAHDILATLNQGVITTDQHSIVTSINTAAVEMLGVTPDCIGKPIAAISSVEIPLDDMSRRVNECREPVSDRELSIDHAGRVRRLVVSALELNDVDGTRIRCVINLRDVTERMLMKEQMWRMQQFASLSTLASGLHHEIKNPITALSLHVQLLEERLQRSGSSEAVAETFGVLKSEVRRLTHTLESFRDFASLQRLRLEAVNVQRVVDDVARLIRPQADRQGVRLELAPPAGPLPEVALDAEKLRQAVLNLVLNALEAMPRGGTLSLRAEARGGEIRVVVADTGPGIPPEVQDHMFHPYFSTKNGGSGVGLAIAEKLVRQHRGRLDYRTGAAGTTFTIALPEHGLDPTQSGTRP
jgi:PAS domain S-box-containing protein